MAQRVFVAICIVLMAARVTYAETALGVWEDLKDKLAPKTVAEVAKKKLDERVLLNPDYRFLAQYYSIGFLGARNEFSNYEMLGPETEEVVRDMGEDDLKESWKYAAKRQLRDWRGGTLFRQWVKGLTSMRVDTKARTKATEIKPPSYTRKLDPYSETESEIRFECNHIAGRSSLATATRIRCAEAANEVKFAEYARYTRRFQFGLDGDVDTGSQSGVVPIVQPYFEAKLWRMETELSYTYPIISIGGENADRRTFIPDIRDEIFGERETAERAELKLTRVVSRHTLLRGGYRFETDTASSFVNVAPLYTAHPYLFFGIAELNASAMTPFLSVNLDRIMGDYTVGLSVISLQSPRNKEWEYQGLVTLQALWGPEDVGFLKKLWNKTAALW